MERVKKIFLSPYTVTIIVIAMYIAKVLLKVQVGSEFNSPVLKGDGMHNLADILVTAISLFTWKLGRKKSPKYPHTRRNAESLLQVGIGVMLLCTVVYISLTSIVGLFATLSPTSWVVTQIGSLIGFEAVKIGEPGYFGIVIAIVGGGAVVSLIVGKYQIKIGELSNGTSLIADGEETLSDGKIEFATFLGICGEHLFHAPIIEYILGIVVARLVYGTAKELLTKGCHTLFHRSLDIEDKIIAELMIPGVKSIDRLVTYSVGGTMAVCIVKLILFRGTQERFIHTAIERHIKHVLEDAGFFDQELYFELTEEPRNTERFAFGIVKIPGQEVYVSATFQDATHLRMHDEEGRIVDLPLEGKDLEARFDFINAKRIKKLYLFGVGSDLSCSGFTIVDSILATPFERNV